ncbi:MAG: tyrosine-type recombinase/integrase [Desulfobacterales bacterium]|nr:tyrosine-type recombinase/integrase [Desulfobacterales bacterium]
MSEEEVEDYFLHCTNDLKWAKATLRVSHYGIRFYFQKVLKRDYHLFSYLKAGTGRKLPCILSREEVTQILHHVTTHHNYAFFHLVYSCGLRLSEGVNIQISDIDKTRMMIHVHRGKGAKDRYVPLPEETLHVLRNFWVTHRNPTFIFPARGHGNNEASTTDKPMPVSTALLRECFVKPGMPLESKNSWKRQGCCSRSAQTSGTKDLMFTLNRQEPAKNASST